jgi:hypothetical protein
MQAQQVADAFVVVDDRMVAAIRTLLVLVARLERATY